MLTIVYNKTSGLVVPDDGIEQFVTKVIDDHNNMIDIGHEVHIGSILILEMFCLYMILDKIRNSEVNVVYDGVTYPMNKYGVIVGFDYDSKFNLALNAVIKTQQSYKYIISKDTEIGCSSPRILSYCS